MEFVEKDELDELADRLMASDPLAYEKLFRMMKEPLLRFGFRFTRDKSLALDVLQDVFMKLWEKRSNLEIKVSFKALLYTMVRNRALNMTRNRSRISYSSEMEWTPENTVQSVENSLNTSQLDDFFRKWIDELPPRRKEAFILSRYHAMSNFEIGEVMGLSKRTVDTHIVHALRYLRAQYDQLETQ